MQSYVPIRKSPIKFVKRLVLAMLRVDAKRIFIGRIINPPSLRALNCSKPKSMGSIFRGVDLITFSLRINSISLHQKNFLYKIKNKGNKRLQDIKEIIKINIAKL